VISAAGGTATPGTVAGGREDYCAELAGGSTDADVRVPAGETCTLDNARVGPNVILARDATLHARGSSIGGNVLSEGAAAVNLLDGTTVGGNIHVERSGGVQVIDARVDGNIHLEHNTGMIVINNSVVDGSIEIEENTGGVEISGNTVGGKLECEENTPPPTGGGNTVNGEREGQCSGL